MILTYILIILLIVAVLYLWNEVRKVKNNKIETKENNNTVILTYKGQQIYKFKLKKK